MSSAASITRESFLDAVVKGAFTVPGDGSLDFEAIVKKFGGYGYEGWFVVEAQQDPKASPPLKMAEIGHRELMRVMTACGIFRRGLSKRGNSSRRPLSRHAFRMTPSPARGKWKVLRQPDAALGREGQGAIAQTARHIGQLVDPVADPRGFECCARDRSASARRN